MKKWYQSKTILINIAVGLTLILALIPSLLTDLGIPDEQAIKIVAIVGFVNNIINIILRFISPKDIGGVDKSQTTE